MNENLCKTRAKNREQRLKEKSGKIWGKRHEAGEAPREDYTSFKAPARSKFLYIMCCGTTPYIRKIHIYRGVYIYIQDSPGQDMACLSNPGCHPQPQGHIKTTTEPKNEELQKKIENTTKITWKQSKRNN